MKIEQAFGIVLQKERIKQNISQETLAFNSGLDRTYISLLERGKRKPTINTVFSVTYALKLEPHEIILEVEKLLLNSQRDNE
ncbi:helix-turn-helix domain-containing protein [Bacillus cereus]|uniref:C.AhdI domain protein n=1 Tax=Bacillus cereus 03BB108 TaxID=451709 RepID=A0AAN0T2W9_BACCE|nr:helix-turn-helix transcriptional regulator [Bacillus cereus]AJI14432.1 C.AhdI domain protein [Bacillus cereus 03BB108]EDX62909.1 transcriptional regulator, XRE family [Bacillus cereus 03BB108]QKH00585.1 helix-turn-helix transcriptional regulator [Bacillus cereus]